MRRVAIVIAIVGLGALSLTGCGGGAHRGGRPPTVKKLIDWLGSSSGGCTVGVDEARAPSDGDKTPWPIEPFHGEASVGASIECETWLSGWISYYEFPSAPALQAALQEHARLRGTHLYCAKGRELVINELVGYDNTADFCRRLGFSIHHPTRN
jgi:hypothetical protein